MNILMLLSFDVSDLRNAALSGTLVPQLGQLKNLQYLNNINGPIPSDLGNLTNLVSLDLYLNRFTGPIPHHIQPILQVADEDYISILNNSF
ncbi:hypothetical protein P8452_49968 [Trifolium repens]|nr:hypothetical protein P8452_49968 [Trifolium repens]